METTELITQAIRSKGAAASLRAEAAALLSDMFARSMSLPPGYSLATEPINRLIDCIISAAVLEYAMVYGQASSEPDATKAKD